MISLQLNKNYFLCFILCFICLVEDASHGAGTPSGVSGELVPQSVKITSTIDKDKITIGDRVTYQLTVTHDPKIKIDEPDITKSLGSFEIKDYETSKPKKKRGKIIREYKYIVTTFTTGEFTIESSTIVYIDQNGEKKKLLSAPIKLIVESIKPSESDKDDIRDIKPPVSVKANPWFWIIAILLIISGLGIWRYLETRKLKKSGVFAESGPPKPVEEIAYERLNKLQTMGLIEQGRIKEYYIILSEIIRTYLENRFNIPVIDRTTREMYLEMKKTNIDKKHMSTIKDFLEECDLVKFAKYAPEFDAREQDYNSAKTIVDITKPVIETIIDKAA